MGEVHAGQQERVAHLIVRAGRECYGLRTTSIRRLLTSTELHPLAGGGQHVAGLVEFAGEPLLVIDLLAELGAGGSCSRSLIVVVHARRGADRETFGIAVDEALEVTTMDGSEVEHADTGDPVVAHAVVAGRKVSVVDIALLGSARRHAAAEAKDHSGDRDAS